MFDDIMEFRFEDGGFFDLRGNRERSINGTEKLLANSVHWDERGLVTSFSVRRPIGFIDKFRLDWIFVKVPPGPTSEGRRDYAFAPHFGETLMDFNENLTLPLSDHNPCIVDLPLADPPRLRESEEE